MTQLSYHAIIAGIDIWYAMRYEMTVRYMGTYINAANEKSDKNLVLVKDYEFQDWKRLGNEVDAYGEYSLLSLQTSIALFEYQRFIFHSVAMRWHEKAWLLTAPPGVGKSTQYKNLKELYPDEVDIISGDRPVIQIMEDQSIMVHPSPWNGKENWHGADAAPLSGIIILKQGQENAIKPLTAKEAAMGVFMSVFHSYDDEQTVRKAAKMATALLKHTPVWLLTNMGDYDSSILLYKTMKQWENEHGDEV